MKDRNALVDRIAALKERGIGGEDLEAALAAHMPQHLATLDTLRILYLEGVQHPLVRWALRELDAEVSELDSYQLAAL